MKAMKINMINRKIRHKTIAIVIAVCLMLLPCAGCQRADIKADSAGSTNAATVTDADASQTDGENNSSVDEQTEHLSGDNNTAAAFTLDSVPAFSGIAYADINDDVPFFTEEELTAETFEEYWPLDELGRCTGAMACIGTELLPSETRGNISEITPTGWHSAKYDSIDGGYLYNRCHLIGYQLTGQNIEERNIITGTRYMNLEGMLPFENSVRMYVEGTGNHVLYRVRPYYRGEDLVAAGVLMEAESIEDPLVRFCAFCYNVQPGIEIDYATGESAEAGGILADEADPAADDVMIIEADPAAENGSAPARSADSREITYILNTNTKKFHYPYCKSVRDMKEKNKRETTMTREEIIEKGYSPCKNCNP